MSKYTIKRGDAASEISSPLLLERDGAPFAEIRASRSVSVLDSEITSFALDICDKLSTRPDPLANARDQARLQYESIREKVRRLEAAREGWPIFEARGDKFARREDIESGEIDESELYTREQLEDVHDDKWLVLEKGEELTEDTARQEIDETPLSVEVRSNWYTPSGDADSKPYEFQILLCTGGPAVRIIGTLDSSLEPDKARIEFQDWFQPWTEWRAEGVADDFSKIDETLLAFARSFYYGEG
jgi:hypothetical protein